MAENRHKSKATSVNRSSKIAQMLQAHFTNTVTLEITLCYVYVNKITALNRLIGNCESQST